MIFPRHSLLFVNAHKGKHKSTLQQIGHLPGVYFKLSRPSYFPSYEIPKWGFFSERFYAKTSGDDFFRTLPHKSATLRFLLNASARPLNEGTTFRAFPKSDNLECTHRKRRLSTCRIARQGIRLLFINPLTGNRGKRDTHFFY
jgi:hypothetical protein